jgi:hypothetical protein
MIRNMEHFTYSNCKVASLLWFAHFGMRICASANLSSCSHLVESHKHSTHFLGEIDWLKVFWRG